VHPVDDRSGTAASEPDIGLLQRARSAGHILAVVALLTAGAVVLVLARLRPDLPITNEPMSEYVHGPYNWLQTSVFFLVGLASILIARQAGTLRKVGERIFLVIWGLGIVTAGVVDVEDRIANTEHGAVHNLVVKLAFLSLFVGAAVDLGSSARERRRQRAVLTVLLGTTMLATAILEGSDGYGVAQRALGTAALVWIIAYARRAERGADLHSYEG